jgi:hypothetical protein
MLPHFSRVVLTALVCFSIPAWSCPDKIWHPRNIAKRIPLESFADDVMGYPKADVIDFASGTYAGKTMLYTQREIIKPLLDEFAAGGFTVVQGSEAIAALDKVAPKVKRNVLRGGLTEANLGRIADELHKQGPISFIKMPDAIAAITSRLKIKGANRFNLPTYFALVSGGGVALRFAPDNYAYNVNYAIGRGTQPGYDPKAIQTGRSFGMGPGAREGESFSLAPNDVSDQTHLNGLQELAHADPEQLILMSRTIIEATGNSDFKSFAAMSPVAQTLASDYFAVYTAEQVRNLMDDSLFTQPWDQSLMEMTLISPYYAKLKEIYVFYGDRFFGVPMTYTNRVYNQYPKDVIIEDMKKGPVASVWTLRKASLADYWQRGQTYVEPTVSTFGGKTEWKGDFRQTRSGINITRPQFRLLGAEITSWMNQNHPGVVKSITRLIRSKGENVYAEISSFFINKRAPESMPELTNQLAEAFVKFQTIMSENGEAIHQSIQAKYPIPQMPSQLTLTKEQAKKNAGFGGSKKR